MIDIEASYKRYGPMVYRRCLAILKNEESALDAMQDVFVAALNRKEKMNDTALSSLFYTIATNISLNHLRSEKKRKAETGDDRVLQAIAGYDDHESRTEARSHLDTIFAGEKESTRTIAVLHFVDGLTLQETAEQVRMSVSGVRKRLRRLKENVAVLGEV